MLRMRRPRGVCTGPVHAGIVVALLTWPLGVHANSVHLPAFAHRNSCALVVRAAPRSVAANSSQQKIKNEAAGRRVLCMLSERAWLQLPRASLAHLPLLTVKPSYPPHRARGEKVRASAATVSSNRTLVDVAARASGVSTPDSQVLPCECTCDDVHDLQQRLQILAGEQRALSRSLYRLESILKAVLEALRSADDVAFLERQTCAVVVYNENLTNKRELRLLREELKKVSDRFGI